MHHKHLDPEGNTVQWLYFNDPQDHLDVRVDLTVYSTPVNTFDFIIFPYESVALPLSYAPELARLLLPYLTASEVAPEVAAWAAILHEDASGQTLPFLTTLTERLRQEFSYVVRHQGPPHPPAETLAAKKGSCRDLACLMIAACRAEGLAARFVSGYAWAGESITSHELHAWVEVYLPGAGWRGFDPTLGAAADERHIALAASAYPAYTAPVRGDYWGGARSQLETDVVIRAKEEA